MSETIVFDTVESVLAEVKRIIQEYPKIEKVILFGSRARGDERYNSDIDLCVFAPETQYDMFSDFASAVDDIYTHYSFDVVFFPHLNNETLKNDVLTEGVEL